MEKFIVTISREFGSGGRLAGEKLALRLGIPFYDRAIIDMASEKSGLSPDFIEKSEERASNSFLYNLSSYLYSGTEADRGAFTAQYEMPVNDKAFSHRLLLLRISLKKATVSLSAAVPIICCGTIPTVSRFSSTASARTE